jgi:hypothetical protein
VGLSPEGGGGLSDGSGSDSGAGSGSPAADADKRSSGSVGLPFFVLRRGRKWRGSLVCANGEKSSRGNVSGLNRWGARCSGGEERRGAARGTTVADWWAGPLQ